MHCYWSSKCQRCTLKNQCTPSTNRRVRRWEHEAVLEEMQRRLNHAPEMMKVRKRTVEHPFGTLKHWMGATHFLTRKLNGVSAEMSLNVLAYNLKRVMKIIGTEGDGSVKAPAFTAPRGAKALNKRSDALSALKLANVREIASPKSAGLRHPTDGKCFYTLWANSGHCKRVAFG